MTSEKDKEAEIDFDAIRKELAEPEQRKTQQLEAGRANLKKLRDYIAPRLKEPKVVKEIYGVRAKFEVCYRNDGNMLVGFGFVASDERNTLPKYQLYLPGREPFTDDYYPPDDVTTFADFEKLVKAVLRELSEHLN
jgi:hypothetical protein